MAFCQITKEEFLKHCEQVNEKSFFNLLRWLDYYPSKDMMFVMLALKFTIRNRYFCFAFL